MTTSPESHRTGWQAVAAPSRIAILGEKNNFYDWQAKEITEFRRPPCCSAHFVAGPDSSKADVLQRLEKRILEVAFPIERDSWACVASNLHHVFGRLIGRFLVRFLWTSVSDSHRRTHPHLATGLWLPSCSGIHWLVSYLPPSPPTVVCLRRELSMASSLVLLAEGSSLSSSSMSPWSHVRVPPWSQP